MGEAPVYTVQNKLFPFDLQLRDPKSVSMRLFTELHPDDWIQSTEIPINSGISEKKKHGRNNPCAPISQSVLGHNSRRTPGLHPLLLQLMIYAMQTCIFRLAFLTNSQTTLLAKQMDRFSGRGVDFFFYFTGKKISDVQIFRKSVERVYFYLFFQRNFHF